MLQNIIFDLGKVLIHYDFSIFFKKIGYHADEHKLDEADEAIIKFESGLMPKLEFLQELQKIYQFSMTMEDFEKAWCEVFFENHDMINLAQRISKNYNTFIFSNTDELHFPYIWNQFPSLHFFKQNLMLSYEIQAVKPDEKAYKKALDRFSLDSSECVFIDDRPKNIYKAQELGFTGFIHKDYLTTKKWLEDILSIKL